MSASVLSVDLGTSNTVAVLSAHGRPPRVVEVDGAANMPSALFAAEDGRPVVGREAERRARLDPARFEPNPTDQALEIDARSQTGGSCDLADSLLRIAFDKLPDA